MKTQVAIVGAGPGGTASSMFLSRLGIEHIIIEKERFPRYHIGESMTGEAGGVLRGLGLEQQLLQRGFPIKHGVKVYGANGRNSWFVPVMQRLDDGLLHHQTTWQVRRSVFDQLLLDTALERGGSCIHGRAGTPLLGADGSVQGVRVQMADGGTQDIGAEIVFDCTGQASWLANRGVTGPKYLGAYDKQIAIFSQLEGFQVDDGSDGAIDSQPGNTLIFYQKKYHWAWAIPLDNGGVSIGIVAPSQYFLDSRLSKQEFLLREMRELNSALAERVESANLVEDVHVIPNYSFQVAGFAGRNYICVGDAHRFLDPIFSFGLYVSIKEADFAAQAARDFLNGNKRDAANPFEDYMIAMEKGADTIEDMIDTFWENPFAFSIFVGDRYEEDLIDVFAGRVYQDIEYGGIRAFRKLLKRDRQYERGTNFSMPYGSRYRPERAPLWNSALDSVETTERWMREQE